MIYTNDHGPPHVHVKASGGLVKITIPLGTFRPEVLEVYGMSQSDVRQMLHFVAEHAELLMQRWRRIHEYVA